MNLRKFISGVSALTIAASAFAGLAVTANAAEQVSTNSKIDTDYTSASFNNGDTDGWTTKSYNGAEPGIGVIQGTGLRITAGYANSQTRNYVAQKVFDTAYDQDVTIVTDLTWYNNTGTLDANAAFYSIVDATGVDIFKVAADGQDGEIYVNGTYKTKISDKYGSTSNGYVRYANWKITVDMNFTLGSLSYSIIPQSDETKAITGEYAITAASVKSLNIGHNAGNKAANSIGATVNSIKLYQAAVQAQTADYTINYTYGNEIVKTVTDTVAISRVITADTYFLVDNTKYFITASEAPTLTVVADATQNVLNVPVRLANTYTAQALSSVDSSVVSSESGIIEGNDATIYYPRYYINGSTAYYIDRTSNSYSTTIKGVTDGNTTATVTYGASSYSDIEYYVEAEDIIGMTAGDDTARLSMGKGAYAGNSTVSVYNLTPGKYKLVTGARQTSKSGSSTFTFKAGDESVHSQTTTGSFNEVVSQEFTVASNTTLTVTGGANGYLLDYVLIVKTAEYVPYDVTSVTPLEVNGSTGAYTTGDKVWAKAYTFTVTPNDDTVTAVKVTASDDRFVEKTGLQLTGTGAIVFGILAAAKTENGLDGITFTPSITVQ